MCQVSGKSCDLHNSIRGNMIPAIEKKWGTEKLCKLVQGEQ